MQKCATCKFRYVENSQMFCAKDPPAAAPIVLQRPAPKLPMLNGGHGGMEMQVQWVSSMRPITPTMGCWQHEPEAPAVTIASRASGEIGAS